MSAATSDSGVSKNMREPSLAAKSKNTSTFAFPPVGPIDRWSLSEWLAQAPGAATAMATARASSI